MNIKTKIVAVLTLAVLVAPGISMAQTMSVSQLQQEIASLTAQLTQLKTQLIAAGGTTTTAWCYTFNNNLSIGITGNEVTALQTALQKDGESVTVNGIFDDQTAAAVTGFQEKYQSAILAPYGLSNGTGYAGKSTRAELNSLFGCTGSNPVTPPIVVNPIVPTSSLPITACPMFVPYCPYGGHSVVESNGCNETVCNSAPAAPSTIYPAGCTSFSGYSSTDGQPCDTTSKAPVINSFSVGAGPTFSLSAYNYNTITFQAQCGSFVAVVQPQNGSPASYPTGSASICNAPQTYSSSSFNENPSIAPQMVNVPLVLYNAQGVVDGSITLVESPAGSNNSGSATLTVNVCNSVGNCVYQTASFPIYAKG